MFKETLLKTEQSIIRFLKFQLLRANSVWCPQLPSQLSRRRRPLGEQMLRYWQQKHICEGTQGQRTDKTALGEDKPLAFLGSQETDPGKLTYRALGQETPPVGQRAPGWRGQRAEQASRPSLASGCAQASIGSVRRRHLRPLLT